MRKKHFMLAAALFMLIMPIVMTVGILEHYRATNHAITPAQSFVLYFIGAISLAGSALYYFIGYKQNN